MPPLGVETRVYLSRNDLGTIDEALKAARKGSDDGASAQEVRRLIQPYYDGDAAYLETTAEIRAVATFLFKVDKRSGGNTRYAELAEAIANAGRVDYRQRRFGDPASFTLPLNRVGEEATAGDDARRIGDLRVTGSVDGADTPQYVAEVRNWVRGRIARWRGGLNERVDSARSASSSREGSGSSDAVASYLEGSRASIDSDIPLPPDVPRSDVRVIDRGMAEAAIQAMEARGHPRPLVQTAVNFVRDRAHLMTQEANGLFSQFLLGSNILNALGSGGDATRRIHQDALAILGADYFLHQSMQHIHAEWGSGDVHLTARMITLDFMSDLIDVERGFLERYLEDRKSLIRWYRDGAGIVSSLIRASAQINSERLSPAEREASFLRFLHEADAARVPPGDIVAEGAYLLFMLHSIRDGRQWVEDRRARSLMDDLEQRNGKGMARLEYAAYERAGVSSQRVRRLAMDDYAEFDVVDAEEAESMTRGLYTTFANAHGLDADVQWRGVDDLRGQLLPMAQTLVHGADAITADAAALYAELFEDNIDTVRAVCEDRSKAASTLIRNAMWNAFGMRLMNEAMQTIHWAQFGGDFARSANGLRPEDWCSPELMGLALKNRLYGFNLDQLHGDMLRRVGKVEENVIAAINASASPAHERVSLAVDALKAIDVDGFADDPLAYFAVLNFMEMGIDMTLRDVGLVETAVMRSESDRWESTINYLWGLEGSVRERIGAFWEELDARADTPWEPSFEGVDRPNVAQRSLERVASIESPYRDYRLAQGWRVRSSHLRAAERSSMGTFRLLVR